MAVVIIDTTVWIDYLRGTENPETLWLDRELQRQRLGLTDLILCEVLQGVKEQRAFLRVKAELLRFQVFQTGGRKLAVGAAQNYRGLRERGAPYAKPSIA
jgi:predicted nucleic acid-binding protein